MDAVIAALEAVLDEIHRIPNPHAAVLERHQGFEEGRSAAANTVADAIIRRVNRVAKGAHQ